MGNNLFSSYGSNSEQHTEAAAFDESLLATKQFHLVILSNRDHSDALTLTLWVKVSNVDS